MRNNNKTSAIDCGGYELTFNVILSPKAGFLASHDCTRFNLVGEIPNRDGGDEGH
jgi:hypothetical protein